MVAHARAKEVLTHRLFFAGSVGVIAGVLAARSVLKFGSAVAAIEARRVGDTRAVGGLGRCGWVEPRTSGPD
jgi:hypothetical protein